FGLMLAVAFLLGTWIASIRMREEGIEADPSTLLMYVMIGGIVGSKLYFAIDVSIRKDLDFWPLLLSRDGITFYGGLIGGVLMAWLGCTIHGVSLKVFTDCMAVVMLWGQALGRIGCFLVGDDYGAVTDVPWGMAFPQGAPPTTETVHPTMLYEMVWLFIGAAVLWRRRFRSPFLWAEYMMWNGAGRFVIEFWRVNEPIAWFMTEPQVIAVALLLSGGLLWVHYRRNPHTRPEPAGATEEAAS
ncbi:MAG: prolipoprotein diacylglyceryl transferase, partial [Myxococcales bacterium]|nr:prolipoprotein diacylglyceryl transferase [Myxococcales bacterium]